ncbi:MAG: exo-alpha-sialidase [Candidatus Hydrogenedentes bacterium]|nr:exo-alpha-sialidase [Candidatus Hydrogenedentota bacterium]
MKWSRFVFVFVFLFVGAVALGQSPGPVKNVVIYDEPGRFAGWPANNGIWSWGDEIVVGFTLGYYKEKPSGHPIDPDRPSQPRLARSLDGGETWTIESPSFLDAGGKQGDPMPCPGDIDFTQPNFAFWVRMQGSNQGFSYFYWSNDRCKTWQGPYQLPKFERTGVFSRTDYIVKGPNDLMAFMTAAKASGGEGWPFCAQTTDGGKTWKHVSWIGKEPGPGGYAIMPSTVRLSDSELFTYIRCRGVKEGGEKWWWIEPYRSLDNGQSWQLEKENSIDNAGNPAHMIKLKDGSLALTYGYRHAPYGVRARISSDRGKTWTGDIILRDDGGEWDLGYPRAAQRADGKIVTAYYFNDTKHKERYIAATIWDPGAVEKPSLGGSQ